MVGDGAGRGGSRAGRAMTASGPGRGGGPREARSHGLLWFPAAEHPTSTAPRTLHAMAVAFAGPERPWESSLEHSDEEERRGEEEEEARRGGDLRTIAPLRQRRHGGDARGRDPAP